MWRYIGPNLKCAWESHWCSTGIEVSVRGLEDPNARTTQVFINLKDNAATHDKEPFVVFGEVVQGIDVADQFYADYGEAAGGGIRAGKQDPVFAGGNKYLETNFPRLDYIKTARVLPR